jgi:CheY-like chemotaxis protein
MSLPKFQKRSRRKQVPSMHAPQTKPFVERLEDRQLLSNGLNGTVLHDPPQVPVEVSAIAGDQQGNGSADATSHLNSAHVTPVPPTHGQQPPHAPPPPTKGGDSGDGSSQGAVQPPGDPHTKPVKKPTKPSKPTKPGAHPPTKPPSESHPGSSDKSSTGSHAGSTVPAKPKVHTPPANQHHRQDTVDVDMQAVALIPSSPPGTSGRLLLPAQPSVGGASDAGEPQPADPSSDASGNGQTDADNGASLALLAAASSAGSGALAWGATGSAGAANKGGDTVSAQATAAGIAAGSSVISADATRMLPLQEIHSPQPIRDREPLTDGDKVGTAPAFNPTNLAAGVYLAAERLARVPGAVSQQEYATAADSVLLEGLATSGNSSSTQAVSDTGSEWGFLLGWALALPPGRMKHQPTIMVVESDEATRDAMTIKLVQEGFLVLPAATGRDAMNVLRTPLSPIDVMLLDTHLPDVSGIHLFERLRQLYPNLPAAVWMGDPARRDSAQLSRLGTHYYLPKPIEMEKLVTTIRGLLG